MRISDIGRRAQRTTEISATVRQVRDKAIAVSDGTMTEVVDPATGEVREIVFINDDDESSRTTPERRFLIMREWVASHLKEAETGR